MKKLFLLLLPFFIVSCSMESFSRDEFSVATWNTQTFFDGQKDGDEYSEFKKGDNWSEEKYEIRLDRLCEIIMELDCDIIILEELENEKIIYDISNHLAGNTWNQNKNWNYACFAKNKGSSIGCGVLSRYELSDLQVHNLNVKIDDKKQPSMRPLLEVTATKGDKNIVIFVNHWKSKSGGAEESEVWRDFQENILCSRINELKDKSYVICGDFNRDIYEFEKGNENLVNLRPGAFGKEVEAVNSCWFDIEGNLTTEQGSYFYNDEWERIDHIFTGEKIHIKSFEVFTNDKICTESGIPKAYKIYTGEGYSDHLPLKAVLSYKE